MNSSNRPSQLQQTIGISWRRLVGLTAAIVTVIGIVILAFGATGKNNFEDWQLKQSIWGDISIIDSAGYYQRWFGKVWTYPRSVQVNYDKDMKNGTPEDEVVEVTFNDGGTATVSAMVRYNLPSDAEKRMKIHQAFSANIHNVTAAVRAHLVNCLKNTAPIMSASEHQSARKAEFNLTVEEQLRKGLYEMRKVARELKDQTDRDGKAITVYATEVVLDEKTGTPVITYHSPLMDYGIEIAQFSITDTQYDAKTKEQFAAKKESFLLAEKSKAQREQEVQQRLMTVEKGLREKAEVEAVANKEKAQAVIEATKKVEVAQQEKLQAETVASQKLAVAKIDKEEALTRASKEFEVAQIATKAAEQQALAIKTLAEAEKQKIAQAGAITEKERVLAQIAADRDAKVAEKLGQIRGPQIVFGSGGNGSGTGSGAADWQSGMWNLIMLRAAGIDIGKTPLLQQPTTTAPAETK